MNKVLSGIINKYNNILRIIISGKVEYIQQLFDGQIDKLVSIFFTNKDPDELELIKRYKKNYFPKFIDADPSPNKQYLQWITKNYINNLKKYKGDGDDIFFEDLYKTTEDLEKFTILIKKQKLPAESRDINKFDFKSLYQLIKQYPLEEADMFLGQDREAYILKTQAPIVYQNERYIVYNTKTYQANKLLGKGTRWCTSADSDNGKYQFDNYSSKGNIYVIESKNGELKFQFHYQTDSFMNEDDDEIGISMLAMNDKLLGDVYVKLAELEFNGDADKIQSYVGRLLSSKIVEEIVKENKIEENAGKINYINVYLATKKKIIDDETANKLVNPQDDFIWIDGLPNWIFGEYENEKVLDLFGTTNRHDYRYWAKLVFNGDSFDNFNSNMSWENFMDNINKENELTIRKYISQTTKTPIKKLNEFTLEQLLDEYDFADDIGDIIARAGNRCQEDADNNENYNIISKAFLSCFTGSDKANDTPKGLAVPVHDLGYWINQFLGEDSEYKDEDISRYDFGEVVKNVLTGKEELIEYNTDYAYGTIDDGYFNERLAEDLEENGIVPVKKERKKKVKPENA